MSLKLNINELNEYKLGEWGNVELGFQRNFEFNLAPFEKDEYHVTCSHSFPSIKAVYEQNKVALLQRLLDWQKGYFLRVNGA